MEFTTGLVTGAIMWGMIVLVLYQLFWRGGAVDGRQPSEADTAVEIKDLRTRLRLIATRYSQEQRRSAAMQIEVAVLQTRLEENGRVLRRLEALDGENEQLRDKLNAARREATGLHAQLESSCDRLNEGQSRWTAAENKIERLQATLLQLTGRAGQWAVKAAESAAKSGQLKEQLRVTNQELADLQAELQQATQQLDEEKSRQQTGPAGDAMISDRLQSIRGVGPVYARRLHEAGVHTFAALAALTPERLKEITGASDWQGQPERWIAEARKFTQARADSIDS